MGKATVKLVDNDWMREFYIKPNRIELARKLIASGFYSRTIEMDVGAREGEQAAEFLFDLTNNPSKEEDREQVYGRRRSLSVGDVVVVGDQQFLCAPFGWEVL